MKKIRFLSDQVYETGGPGKGPRFASGSTLARSDVGKAINAEVTSEWAEGFLQRWVKRGVAEDISNETAAERKAAEQAAEDARKAELQAQERVTALLALAADSKLSIADGATEAEIVAALEAAGVEVPQG